MWLVLFSCLSPAGLDRLPKDVEGTDTAATDQPEDDSGTEGKVDSGADDSAAVGIDDSAAPSPHDTSAPAVDSCDWMSWNNVGAPFFTTWCTACHGSDVPEEKRQGAPEECNLDTYERVVAWAPSIEVKLATGTMPPQGTPPDDTKSAVLEWLECGAPE
jgi:hypothetical protein